jgi:UDP-N-acetylmuramate dehydrogenase
MVNRSERERLECVAEEAKLNPRRDVLGRAVSTVAVGGPLAALFEPETVAEAVALVRSCAAHGVPYRVLGAGSNILISDRGLTLSGVIRLGRGFRTVRALGADEFEVGGAVALMTLARNLGGAGLAGLEFAGGIPASIGGAVRMNAGAHGGQIADIVVAVNCLLPSGEIVELSPRSLEFRYRHAELPAGAIVVGARIRLVEGDRTTIEARRADFLARRKATQPLTTPSFGSVFKNPSGERSAGAVLERVGMKGYRCGGALVSTLHANWIVNPERTASAADVVDLIEACRKAAWNGEGVALEPEVVRWFEEGEPG